MIIIIRLVIILAVLFALAYFGKQLFRYFYDPHRCPRCKGEGYWRGTRPDEKEKCDMCFGTGRI